MKKQSRSRRLLAVLLLILLAVGLLARPAGRLRPLPGRDSRGAGEKPLAVVATIFPLADMARQIGGERVNVTTLLPAGASPHTFEPTPGQARLVAGADLLLLIGAGLDPWAERLLQAGERPPEVRLALVEGLRPADLEAVGFASGPAACDHGISPLNPHLWLDPVLVRDRLSVLIEERLAALDPGGRAVYREQAAVFRAELTALDQAISQAVASFSTSAFVSFHPAWTWFAARYGLEEAGVIRHFPERDPTPGDIRRLAAEIEGRGIRAIFAEKQFSPEMAATIAAETGAAMVTLDPLGGAGLAGRDSYPALLRYNLDLMSRVMR